MSSPTDAVDSALATILATCTKARLWAEQDEGPYHREAQPRRRHVVEDRDGTAVQLGIRLTDDQDRARTDATVEIWHCDAHGRYSGFPPPDSSETVSADTAPKTEYVPEQTFLRGSQPTDQAGMVEFHTIFPGWYPGRTVHIHLMVHTAGHSFTSQLYFPDELTDRILATEPYAQRPNRDTTNETDEIFPTGGNPAVLDMTPLDEGKRAAIALILPVDPEATS